MVYTGSNLSQLTTGLDSYLKSLEGAISSRAFGGNLPLFGSHLNNSPVDQFIEKFRSSLHTQLESLGDLPTPKVVQQVLFNTLGSQVTGLGLLQDLDGNKQITIQDIRVVETSENVTYSLKLGQNPNLLNLPINADLGLPKIGFSIDGTADIRFGYTFNLDFGLIRLKVFM